MSIFKDGAYHPLGSGEEMSEGEYEYQYALCNGEMDEPPKSLEVASGLWHTRDGRIISIRRMASDHLSNAISLFTRTGWGEHPKINELEGTPGKPPEA